MVILMRSAPLIEVTTSPASKITYYFNTTILRRHRSQHPKTVSKKEIQIATEEFRAESNMREY